MKTQGTLYPLKYKKEILIYVLNIGFISMENNDAKNHQHYYLAKYKFLSTAKLFFTFMSIDTGAT